METTRQGNDSLGIGLQGSSGNTGTWSVDEKMGQTYIHYECANTLASRDYKQPQAVIVERERERERAVVYGIDRAAFNCGANAQFDFPITEEVSTVLRARGPNAVAVPRRSNESIHDEDKTRM